MFQYISRHPVLPLLKTSLPLLKVPLQKYTARLWMQQTITTSVLDRDSFSQLRYMGIKMCYEWLLKQFQL